MLGPAVLVVLLAGCGGAAPQAGFTPAEPLAPASASSSEVDADAGTPTRTKKPARKRTTPSGAGIVVGGLTSVEHPQLGTVVVDDKGWVLYRFDADQPAPPRSECVDECARAWPPVLGDDLRLDGVPSENVGWILRADGGRQVTLNGWPLYRYTGDEQPGDVTGQGASDRWFAVTADGSKNATPPG